MTSMKSLTMSHLECAFCCGCDCCSLASTTIVSFCSWISLGRNDGSAIIVTVVVVVSVVVCSLCATNAVVTSLLNFIESAVAAATVAADVVANDTSVVAGSVSDSRFTSSSNRRETDDANRRNGFRTVPPDLCMSSMYFGMSSLVTVSIAVNIPSSFTRAYLRFLIGRWKRELVF